MTGQKLSRKAAAAAAGLTVVDAATGMEVKKVTAVHGEHQVRPLETMR